MTTTANGTTAQNDVHNRPDSALVPVVGESAVLLSALGLTPLRVPSLPLEIPGRQLVRARRDRVGTVGELRAMVVEDGAQSVLGLSLIPTAGMDLGTYAVELWITPTHATASFTVHTADGTWFAGQHAHGAYQRAQAARPALVPDDATRSARARERGFSFQVQLGRDELPALESLHRTLWTAHLESLVRPLELSAESTERHARALEAWKAHQRTSALVPRTLATLAGADELCRLHAEVMTA